MKRVLSSAVMFALLFSFISFISFDTALAEEDTVAPEIDLSSLYFDAKEIQYGEYNYLHAKITDQSIIKTAPIVYTSIDNSVFLDGSDGLYSAIFRGERYVRYQVEAIKVQDTFDNAAFYVDPRFEEKYAWDSENCEIRYADFSDLYFDVVKQSVHNNALVLPDNLISIGSKAFVDLPSIEYVYIPKSVTSIADDAFDENIEIIAPSGSYAIEWAQNHGFTYSIEN